MNQNYYNWQQLMQQVAQQNAAKQTPFLPTNQQAAPPPTSLFDKSQYSRFGNAMARGGGFGPMLNNSALQQQITTPDELEMYNQARKAARNKGLGQMMYALSDAFGGRDIGKGVQERQLAQSGGNATSLMQNEQYIARLYQLRNALPENDPQRAMFDVRIRNAEAGIGAYKYDPNRQFDITEAKRVAGSTAGLDLTDYQRKTDEAFATEAVKFESIEKWQLISNIDKLDQSIDALKESDNLTGPIIGNTPNVILAFTNPEAVGLEDDVRSIVYQALRATLGPQFTENEGNRLVASTFNQLLGEEVNMKRLERLRAETYNMMKAKEDKIAYLKNVGTLRGYEGEQSIDSLINAIIKPEDYAGLSDDQLMTIFKDPNTSEAELNAIRKLVGG